MRPARRALARPIVLGLALLPLLAGAPARAAEVVPAATANAGKALADMEALAAKDDPTALVALADAYQRGSGVSKDVARAAGLYERAATLGDAEAQYRLGNLYLLGDGVERDDDWAFTWFRAAARQGHAQARRNVEEFYRAAGLAAPAQLDDGAPTPALLPPTTAAPDSEQAQEHSAARHPQPVPDEATADEMAALELLRSKGIAVETGASEATDPQAPTAEPLAAVADLPAARELLAAGKPLAALPGLEQLAKGGNPEAQWMLSGVLATLNRSGYDLARSLQWLKKSAQGGWRDAQFALAGRYERGEGQEADEAEAISWYRAAARQGHPEALERLRAIYRAAGVSMPPLETPAPPAASPEPTRSAPARPSAGMDANDDPSLALPVASANA